MPSNVSMKELLETGVHFGHRTTKWNPKMKPFIFTERNGIHIIDLQQTIANLNTYYDMIRDIAARGGVVLFVGTKRQAQEAVAREAERAEMPYINTRWLGGTLTNWITIRKSLDALRTLERRREKGDFERLTKKEQLTLGRKIEKLNGRLGGIRNMKKLPDLILVIDTKREATAVKEANTLNIPVLAIADTNSDPDQIDYIIPGNDDAVRALKLVVGALADDKGDGVAARDAGDFTRTIDTPEEDEQNDEALLGEGVLARIREANLDLGDE